MPAQPQLRVLSTIADLQKAFDLQVAVWGPQDATPLSHLILAGKIGGLVLGAFDGAEVVGFAYGFPAYDGSEAWLASHMLAVAPAARNRGLGRKLKWAERAWALAHGYRRMTWTFDPLEAKNAYLNIEHLGAVAAQYIDDCYGEMTDAINAGMPSDRLLADWRLDTKDVADRENGGVRPAPLTQNGERRIAVPTVIQDLRRADPEQARRERLRVRAAFHEAMADGYVAVRFDRAASCYVLAREQNAARAV